MAGSPRRLTSARRLVELPGFAKILLMLGFDAFLVALAFWLALSLRFGEWVAVQEKWAFPLLLAVLGTLLSFWFSGFYRVFVRYLGSDLIWQSVKGATLAALAWGTTLLLTDVQDVPRSVVLIYLLCCFLLVVMSRLAVRNLLVGSYGQAVAIYGVNESAVQLASALRHGTAFTPSFFLDESVEKEGRHINGIPLFSLHNFAKLCQRFDVKDLFVTVRFASRAERRRVLTLFEPYPVRVRMLPSMSDITEGVLDPDKYQLVEIEDLLEREKIEPISELLEANVRGQSVMVTGAGGTIGAELCRQVLANSPSCLVFLDSSEHALYQVDLELREKFPELESGVLQPILGSVLNRNLLESTMRNFATQTIYHAAAHKHVPLVESNVAEGVRNNVFGTLTLFDCAARTGAKTLVLISTDKAVRPESVMGASKRLAELILRARSQTDQSPRSCVVRFGNVLGSSGSVFPLFKRQIAAGGPLTITHPDMKRYFMTIAEAVELVIQAGAMAEGGEVFVLDMGEPVSIDRMAKRMVHLYGLSVKDAGNPDGDIEIRYTGPRPGEKMNEQLLIESDIEDTRHKRVMRSQEGAEDWENLQKNLEALWEAVSQEDTRGTKALLRRICH